PARTRAPVAEASRPGRSHRDPAAPVVPAVPTPGHSRRRALPAEGTRAAGRGRARRPEGPGTESSSCAFRDGVVLNPSRAHRRPGGENSPSRGDVSGRWERGNQSDGRSRSAGDPRPSDHHRARAQQVPGTPPRTLTHRQEIDTFVLWRSTMTRPTRRSTPAWSRARRTPLRALLSLATEPTQAFVVSRRPTATLPRIGRTARTTLPTRRQAPARSPLSKGRATRTSATTS